MLSRVEALEYLKIPEKNFNNYVQLSGEIECHKENNRLYFNKRDLRDWNKLKKDRTIKLSLNEYKKCFEFAIKMAYSGLSKHGIRGQRSEVQQADDVILGILAEYAIKKFFKRKFDKKLKIDMDIHTGKITAQDIVAVLARNKWRKPRIGIGIKASKSKSCALVLSEVEYEENERKSHVYIFARVWLPSDHLFRILRNHSFFKKARKTLEQWKKKYPEDTGRNTIDKLGPVSVWICGFAYHRGLERRKHIPGQEFDGFRYIKSVSELYNFDEDWERILNRL